jgi:hypothetical protein
MKAMKHTILTTVLFLLATVLHANDLNHYVVYQAEDRFAGWPANNGAWIFSGDDLLVGFTEGPFVLQEGHNIGPEADQRSWLARSEDGGRTWSAGDPQGYVGDFGEQPDLKPLLEPINFSEPKFAMRMVGTAYHGAHDPRGHFFYSYDAGVTWRGPHGFGDLMNHPELERYGLTELTPRTDYIVIDRNTALIMVSARLPGKFATDRLFCLRTTDGGRSFFFLGWIVPPYDPDRVDPEERVPLNADPKLNPHPSNARAVMSQSFMTDDGSIVTAVRRRFDDRRDGRRVTYNWVDAYRSVDMGRTWQHMAVLGNAGKANGNPPALNVTEDGRLCAVFGERDKGQIQVSYSADQGRTWSNPEVLRDDFWSPDMETNDLGYPRLMRRSDGKMVAVYYYSTKEQPHGIFATIWDPEIHNP